MECGKHFTAKRGLAVHTRTAHPKAHHSKLTVKIRAAIGAQTKRRWDEDELADMAMEEARLRGTGVKTINAGKGVATVNTALAAFMPSRTLESIKGQRRRPDYKSLVESYLSACPEETVVPPRGTTYRSPCGEVQVPPPTSGSTTVLPDKEIPTQEETTPRCTARAVGGASLDSWLLSTNEVPVSPTTTRGTMMVPSDEISAREATTPRCTA